MAEKQVYYVAVFSGYYSEFSIYKDSVFTKKSDAIKICKKLNEIEEGDIEYEVYGFYLNPRNNWGK